MPTWAQSLLLMLVFFVGSAVSSVFYLTGVENNTLTYAVSMIFPLAFAYIASRRNQRAGLGFVPVDEPRKGAFGSMLPLFALVVIGSVEEERLGAVIIGGGYACLAHCHSLSEPFAPVFVLKSFLSASRTFSSTRSSDRSKAETSASVKPRK